MILTPSYLDCEISSLVKQTLLDTVTNRNSSLHIGQALLLLALLLGGASSAQAQVVIKERAAISPDSLRAAQAAKAATAEQTMSTTFVVPVDGTL